MKDFYIADAASFENQPITSFFCIAAISARDRKGSGQYLAITLADKTGQFEARMWEDFAEALQTCPTGSYVKGQGQISKYQGKFQITLTKLRLAAASEIDTADFVPTTQYDIPTMAAELRSYVAAFRNPHLRRLVLAFLDDPTLGPAFIEAPAAKRLHHAWIGGLLEHVLHLVRICLATAPFYPEVDPDLLVTGAILHDIGKVRELSWGSSFDYTLEGQLIGHISIAQGLLHEKIAQLNAEAASASQDLSSRPESAFFADVAERPAAPPPPLDPSATEPFPQNLRLLIEHMILSHHGKLEFGSPKLPMTPEAMLLSALDDLEAKFQALRNEFANAAAAGRPASEPTEWVRSMDRPLFNSQAWLDKGAGTRQVQPASQKVQLDSKEAQHQAKSTPAAEVVHKVHDAPLSATATAQLNEPLLPLGDAITPQEIRSSDFLVKPRMWKFPKGHIGASVGTAKWRRAILERVTAEVTSGRFVESVHFRQRMAERQFDKSDLQECLTTGTIDNNPKNDPERYSDVEVEYVIFIVEGKSKENTPMKVLFGLRDDYDPLFITVYAPKSAGGVKVRRGIMWDAD
jgi:3'-5' exoribonuclease